MTPDRIISELALKGLEAVQVGQWWMIYIGRTDRTLTSPGSIGDRQLFTTAEVVDIINSDTPVDEED
jgi:hypothetical protein